jgi:hypothetical protein
MKRFVLVLVVLMMTLVAFNAPARAQGAGCGLSDADCKILATADANIAKITSFAHSYDFALKVNAQGQTVDVTSKGSGVFSVDPAGMTGSDPTAALGSLKLTLDLDGAAKMTGNDQSGKAQLVVVDGVIYANAGDGKGWQGVKLSDLLSQAMSQTGAGGTASANPQVEQVTKALQDPALMQAITAIPTIKGFITLAKAAGPTIDGAATTAFTYTLDFKTLISAPEFAPVVKTLFKSVSGTGSEVTDAQVAQMTPLFSSLLKDTTFTITRYVGEKDNLYHGIKVYLKSTIDTTALGSSGAPVDLLLSLDVQLSKIGNTFEVKAPEGAKMVAMPVATPAK